MMLPRPRTCLLLAVPLLVACHHRRVPAEGDAGEPDLAIVVRPSTLCTEDPLPVTEYRDPQGAFMLALPAGVDARRLSIEGVTPDRPASAVRLAHQGVAGLVVARPATSTDVMVEEGWVRRQFAHALIELGELSLRSAGLRTTSHDGLPALGQAIWDVELDGPLDVGQLRAWLAVGMLPSYRPVTAEAGERIGLAAQRLVVQFAAALRPDGQVLLSAAVTTRESYADGRGPSAQLLDDLANGTALAAAGSRTDLTCVDGQLDAAAKADIIFVMDESGSMNDNRADVVRNANRLFAKARDDGLDFRVGVAGMRDPERGIEIGRFCSSITDDERDPGGADRFLLPDEQKVFSSCIENPPYLETSREYGLAHGYHAVARHLPRAPDDPGKIRTDALLALIFVTDEAPQELKLGGAYEEQPGFLDFADYRGKECSLNADKAERLQRYLAPWFELYGGALDPEAQAMVHLVGGICGNRCSAELAHGYIDLARRFGGHVGDVCQADLGPTLQLIVDSIAARAAPWSLSRVPISSTLSVEVNGVRVARDSTRGFIYDATVNTIGFAGLSIPTGSRIVASYRHFVSR